MSQDYFCGIDKKFGLKLKNGKIKKIAKSAIDCMT
jgi:hypothetical protein